MAPNDMKLDGMLKKLKTLYGRDERNALLSDIQDYLYEKRYSIPFAEVDTIYGVSDKLRNFVLPRTISHVNVKDWQVEE